LFYRFIAERKNQLGRGDDANNDSQEITMRYQLSAAVSLMLCGLAGAQAPPGGSIHPSPPVHASFKACQVIVGYPGKPDVAKCTSAVLPNSDILCYRATGGGTQCHLHFEPSKRDIDIPPQQSAGNGNDSTVEFTCPGTPQKPYGLQCTIQIKPNPDNPPHK
jgi:hypothetical protein